MRQVLHVKFQLRNPGRATVVKAAVHKTAPSHLAKIHPSLTQHLCLAVEVSPGIPWCLGTLMIQAGNLLLLLSGIQVVSTVRSRLRGQCVHGRVWPWYGTGAGDTLEKHSWKQLGTWNWYCLLQPRHTLHRKWFSQTLSRITPLK